jgi:ABC-type uncharacterized transport system substrate-binding protein
MNRRELVALVGAGMAYSTSAARTQPTFQRMRRIGVLVGIGNDAEGEKRLQAFENRLGELGWTSGTNIAIDVRWAAGSPERIRSYAMEFANKAPDVILATSTPVAAALHNVVKSVPIVFVVVTDPVGNGLVTNMRRPDGNITGFTNFEISMGGKWIEKLKEIAPSVSRVGIVFNPANEPEVRAYYGPSLEAAAAALKIESVDLPVHDGAEIERAMATFGDGLTNGLVMLPDNTTVRYRDLLVALAAEHALPAIYPYRYFAVSGGLLSYGIDTVDLYKRAAAYVDRILRGAAPADLPIQQPTKFEVIVNLKAAKAINLDVPYSLIATANEVIE